MSSPGFRHSPETIEKMRVAQDARWDVCTHCAARTLFTPTRKRLCASCWHRGSKAIRIRVAYAARLARQARV